MDNEIKTWLYDILKSIQEIESFIEKKPKQFEEYISDIKTKRAIERNLEIIGEAVNRSIVINHLPKLKEEIQKFLD